MAAAVQLDPDKLKAAIAAIKDNDGDAALAILEAILTGDSAPTDAPADAATEVADPAPAAPTDPAPAATGRLDKAASAALMRLTGCATEDEALTQYRGMQESVAASGRAQAAVELNTRRGLIVELIKLGVETPKTAWQGLTLADRDKRVPVKRLADESIEEMTERIATLRPLRRADPTPPVGESGDFDMAAEVAKLNAAQIAQIKKSGKNAEEFIAAKRSIVKRV